MTSEASEDCNTADRNQDVEVKSSHSAIARVGMVRQNRAHLRSNLQHTRACPAQLHQCQGLGKNHDNSKAQAGLFQNPSLGKDQR